MGDDGGGKKAGKTAAVSERKTNEDNEDWVANKHGGKNDEGIMVRMNNTIGTAKNNDTDESEDDVGFGDNYDNNETKRIAIDGHIRDDTFIEEDERKTAADNEHAADDDDSNSNVDSDSTETKRGQQIGFNKWIKENHFIEEDD